MLQKFSTSKLCQLGLVGLIGSLFCGSYHWAMLRAQPIDQTQPTVTDAGPDNPELAPVLIGAGDIANCETQADNLTAEILDRFPTATVFTLGDNVYPQGTAKQFQDCYEPNWGRHKQRTYPSPGNHDYYAVAGKPDEIPPYYTYFGDRAGPPGQGYYSFDLGAWHIVSLNSNIAAESGSAQAQWLEKDLKTHPNTCTVAYWHHPVFSSGLHGNNPKMKATWETLSRFGVDVVVNGHDHDYERFAPQTAEGKPSPVGIREFVVGTGGTDLRPVLFAQKNSEVIETTTHGVLKLTLHPTAYDWEFIPINGQTFQDQGTAHCVKTAADG